MFEKFDHDDAELSRHTEPQGWTGHDDVSESGYREANQTRTHRTYEFS